VIKIKKKSSELRSGAALLLLRHGDLDAAWKASEDGIRAIGNNHSLTEFWTLRFIQAQVQSFRGLIEEALRYLDSLGSPSPQDTESIINLNMHRGYFLAMLGRYDSSRALLSRAETSASTSDLPELQGEVRVRRAMVACLEHDLDGAQKLYRSVIDIQGKKYGEYLHCVALAGVGKTFMGRKQYPDALSWLGRALAIATSEEFGLLRSAIMGEMGVSYLGAGDPERSLQVHLQVDKLLSESGVRRSYPMNLSHIGNVYLQKGDFVVAIAYYHRALVIAKEIKFAACIESCTFNMRFAYKRVSNFITESASDT
jgi:tetratricopeptide (TPR) repeat protein